MELKFLHFVLVVLVAVAADMLLSMLDRKVETLAESIHEEAPDPVEDRWSHHHPAMGAIDYCWRQGLRLLPPFALG